MKSGADIYGLIRQVPFEQLLDRASPPISRPEFDKWHRAATLALTDANPKLCVGWAAKIINVYLKTSVYVGGMGRAGLATLIHPPIDGGLWKKGWLSVSLLQLTKTSFKRPT